VELLHLDYDMEVVGKGHMGMQCSMGDESDETYSDGAQCVIVIKVCMDLISFPLESKFEEG
jgi:hypothetical protein